MSTLRAGRQRSSAEQRVWVGLVVSVVFAVVSLSAHGVGLAASGDVRLWAVAAGWTLAAAVALGGTLAAVLRLEWGTRVAQAWGLWALGAGAWLVGVLVRDARASLGLSSVADAFWLLFAVGAILGVAYQTPPGFLFRLFLLDSLPVVLLVAGSIRIVSRTPFHSEHVGHEIYLLLYPVVYGVLVLLVARVLTYQGHPITSGTTWMLSLGFVFTGIAALVWAPEAHHRLAAEGNLGDPLWSVGLSSLGLAGFARALHPAEYVTFAPLEKEGRLGGVAPAGATVGLLVLLVAAPRDYGPFLYGFALVAVLSLASRYYLLRNESTRLLEDAVRAREEAREAEAGSRRAAERLRHLSSEVTSKLGALETDTLLQRVCDIARNVIGAQYAAILLSDGDGEQRFVISGLDDSTRVRIHRLPEGAGVLGAMLDAHGPTRLERLSEHPASGGFPASHPPMETFLGSPIRTRDGARSAIYLTEKVGGFTDEDEMLLLLLASDVGNRIANAELYAELLAQERRLADQNERLRELDRLKDEFVSLVSHELRTPLTSIIGYLELLGDDESDQLTEDERSRFLAIVQRNSERLLRLVGDLLFIAQLDSGTFALDCADADLAKIATACIEGITPIAEDQGVELELSAEEVPAIVGDPARLAQVLDNLVSNAIKFTPEGGTVTVRVLRRDDGVVVEVQDTGTGIPAAEHDRVFDRFARASSAAVQAIPGTGLGLAVTRAIVEAHKGRIELESREGEGSTFRVTLPLPSAAI